MIQLSVVCPAYNEELGILSFLMSLKQVLDGMQVHYEVLIVNDGSSDSTRNIVNDFDWDQLVLIDLSVNSGHMNALKAGFAEAQGEWVMTLDSDLQHPPELIPTFLEEATKNNVEVVYGVRSSRSGDNIFKRTTAKAYYKFVKRMTNIEVISSAADFRLVSRKIVNMLNSVSNQQPIYRLLIPSLGFNYSVVEYKTSKRNAGQSKYTLSKMFKLFIESIVGFTTKPLYFSVYIGLFFSLFSVASFVYVIVVALFGNPYPGWASLASAILFLFGVMFLVIGIQGIYLGEILRQISDNPKLTYKVSKHNRKKQIN